MSSTKGQNTADKATKQIADAEARVTDDYGRVRQKALSNEIAKGIPTNVPGVNQAYGKTALGKMGINPNMIGPSSLPSSVFGNKGYKGLDKSYTDLQGNQVIGNTQGLFSAPEIQRIGELRDLYAGSEDEQTSSDLERLSRFNRVLGFRPTAGMGFVDSLKQNFGGLQAQREFARLGNTAKGIMNLMPGKALATGLFNAVTGSNIPSQFSMSPINYDITDRMSNFYGDEGFNPMLSSEDQEMFGDSFLDRALFGTFLDKTSLPNLAAIEDEDTYQFTGGTPPFTIQDQFKIDPSVYNPSLNIGLDEDQLGRDIMVNPGNDVIGFGAGQVDPQLAAAVNLNEMKPFGSIASNAITDPNSIVNQMYNEMGVDMDSQQMGDALTNTFPFMGYFKN
tara:strand:+ start:895 stop:2070 length:1176 start_codon:yes stop_codon:yes gene_type:complete